MAHINDWYNENDIEVPNVNENGSQFSGWYYASEYTDITVKYDDDYNLHLSELDFNMKEEWY